MNKVLTTEDKEALRKRWEDGLARYREWRKTVPRISKADWEKSLKRAVDDLNDLRAAHELATQQAELLFRRREARLQRRVNRIRETPFWTHGDPDPPALCEHAKLGYATVAEDGTRGWVDAVVCERPECRKEEE